MKGIIKRKLAEIKLLNKRIQPNDWISTLERINGLNGQIDRLVGYKVVLKLRDKG